MVVQILGTAQSDVIEGPGFDSRSTINLFELKYYLLIEKNLERQSDFCSHLFQMKLFSYHNTYTVLSKLDPNLC